MRMLSTYDTQRAEQHSRVLIVGQTVTGDLPRWNMVMPPKARHGPEIAVCGDRCVRQLLQESVHGFPVLSSMYTGPEHHDY
jgi:hypothetical protein